MKSNSYTNIRKSVIVHNYGTHKKSVRKVSNGREITFEVLCSVREMYM